MLFCDDHIWFPEDAWRKTSFEKVFRCGGRRSRCNDAIGSCIEIPLYYLFPREGPQLYGQGRRNWRVEMY
ncbi:unnamed protein product [Allacma fusca]|uniref:Uncharacterized protein n=1 Tax=Allacma fusca TaxID=39272 RepID=A0A8J2K705_9HEXA|nr:unnamed protein product [Allacma fusca]